MDPLGAGAHQQAKLCCRRTLHFQGVALTAACSLSFMRAPSSTALVPHWYILFLFLTATTLVSF